jgi:hypothetical protein
MQKREGRCPLCGAALTAREVLDACEEVADGELGVLACRCPYCQGSLEVLPAAGRVDIGYVMNGRFDVVLSLPEDGLTVERGADGTLKVAAPGRGWGFSS